MRIKDRVFEWFIRRVVVSKTEIIDKPGFVVSAFGSHGKTSLREFFIGETLIQNIEGKIGKKEALYSAGKRFGYMYALSAEMPTIKDISEGKFKDFIYFMIRYIETLYASRLSHEIDYEERIFRLKMNDYIVCRNNGLGYLFSSGSCAGLWAYACQDNAIEGVQPRCQGRGDPECELVLAPHDKLVKMGHKPMVCKDMKDLVPSKGYRAINKMVPTQWAKNSLKDLIEHKVFKYSHGQATYNNERFFLCEASFIYLLERELKKLSSGMKVLWDVSFDFGKKLASISEKEKPTKFIMGFFPALGFGDIMATKVEGKYSINLNHFPWTKWADDIDFVMVRGLLSGVISGFEGREVKLSKVKKRLSGNGFSLMLSE